ncbi:lysozyme inhibitor LprI family protein [Inquilinus sp. OTU3971]|uniref:lysozyme inhibitor LprI family protein n=1 Tax=Inquilinus sp. OTU3971 TaxID=3043855 RepID=UPI00313C07DC
MRASLAGLVALLAVAAVAGPTRARADDCDNAQAGQADLNECYGKAFKVSDAELNRLYKEITGRLKDDPDTTRLLVATQRTWVSFRDAECDFQTSAVAGGTAAPMIHAMCLDGQTKSRIEDFKAYLNCEEGDMSCPVPAAN